LQSEINSTDSEQRAYPGHPNIQFRPWRRAVNVINLVFSQANDDALLGCL
jgi:hypothetical protein